MEKNIVLSNPIVVMKFGGTSLRNEESRAQAIKHIQSQFDSGKQIIVVVSAMGRKGEPYATDTLISLLKDNLSLAYKYQKKPLQKLHGLMLPNEELIKYFLR